MQTSRVFLDTAFVQALLNQRDKYHLQARELLPAVRMAQEVWITEAVLVEIGNAFSTAFRPAATAFIRQCYATDNIQVVPVDTPLLQAALVLYETRTDKRWGLTDCISFVVMQEQGLQVALTADHHFVQAGFQILLN